MAASVYSVARNLYAYACGNAARIAEIQTAFDASMSGGALTKGGLDAVTSATKNSVTMQKMVGMSETDRQTAMRYAITWLQAGIAPSGSRSIASFQ